MKNLKSILTMAISLLITVAAQSQTYRDYDLKTYYTPDIIRNSLDLTFKTAGSFEENKSGDNKNTYKSITGDFSGHFNRHINTRSFYGGHDLTVHFSGLYNDASNNTDRKYFIGELEYTNTSRFYMNNKFFFETGGSVFGRLTKQKYDTNTDTRYLGVSIPLMIGKGRIEDVTDARQAVYILENLSKNGLLKRKLSNDEVSSLAQIMSKVKNKRFLDSRLRQIEEISTVDSFFVSNDLLVNAGASYYTTLYDYWMHGALFNRSAGTVLSGGITPNYAYNYSKHSTDNDKYTTNTYGINAQIKLQHEHPANLYWQHSMLLTPSATFNHIKMPEDKRETTDFRVYGQYSLGYYPTSRSNIRVSVFESLDWVRRKYDLQDYTLKTFSSNTAVSIDLYYYFSQNLRLAANTTFNYYYMDNKNVTTVTHSNTGINYTATLTYSIF